MCIDVRGDGLALCALPCCVENLMGIPVLCFRCLHFEGFSLFFRMNNIWREFKFGSDGGCCCEVVIFLVVHDLVLCHGRACFAVSTFLE